MKEKREKQDRSKNVKLKRRPVINKEQFCGYSGIRIF